MKPSYEELKTMVLKDFESYEDEYRDFFCGEEVFKYFFNHFPLVLNLNFKRQESPKKKRRFIWCKVNICRSMIDYSLLNPGFRGT